MTKIIFTSLSRAQQVQEVANRKIPVSFWLIIVSSYTILFPIFLFH
jgi:hypothetical protein